MAKTKTHEPPPAYVDAKGLAHAFSVSARTVARWIETGVPAIDISAVNGASRRRKLRFHIPAVAAWIEDCAARKSLSLPALSTRKNK